MSRQVPVTPGPLAPDVADLAVSLDLADARRGDQVFVRLRRQGGTLRRAEATFAEELKRELVTFSSIDEARAAFVETLDTERARGRHIAANDDEAIALCSARHAGLEAAILAAADDPAPSLVYADWLQAQGDWRGEWIVVAHAAEQQESDPALQQAAARYFDAHRRHLLGPIARLAKDRTRVKWRRGFIRSVHFKEYVDASMLLLPASLLLDAVTALRLAPAACETLVSRGPATQVRELVLGAFDPEPHIPVHHGDLTLLDAAFPRLEKLVLRGVFQRVGLALPSLREFEYVGPQTPWLEELSRRPLDRCRIDVR